MAPAKRKRGRPRSAAPRALALPDLLIPGEGDGAPDDARQALAAAEGDAGATPAHAGDVAGGDSAAPATALSDSAEVTRDRATAATSSPAAPPASPAPRLEATPAPLARPPKGASLTGKQYRGLKAEQLRALLAQSENDRTQLRARLDAAAPLAAAATDETLATACGETWATIADLAAMFYGAGARLTSEQKARLGELWAPAIRPYLGGAAAHAPLLAAIAATAGIGFEKYWTIRAERAPVAVVEPPAAG